MTNTHVFTLNGLGEGPFKLVNYISYNAKDDVLTQYRNAPKFDIGRASTCAHCGTFIINHCVIKNNEGKTFAVGSSCVKKTGDSGLRKSVSEAINEIVRTKKEEKWQKESKEWDVVFTNNKDKLDKFPHPNGYFAKQGKTLFDYYKFSGFSSQRLKQLKKLLEI